MAVRQFQSCPVRVGGTGDSTLIANGSLLWGLVSTGMVRGLRQTGGRHDAKRVLGPGLHEVVPAHLAILGWIAAGAKPSEALLVAHPEGTAIGDALRCACTGSTWLLPAAASALSGTCWKEQTTSRTLTARQPRRCWTCRATSPRVGYWARTTTVWPSGQFPGIPAFSHL